jgi:hypothetical protein
LEDYAGKTDRELLVEIYTEMKNTCGILEDHEGRIGDVEKDANQAKGGLAVIGIGFTLLSAKVLGLLKLLGL